MDPLLIKCAITWSKVWKKVWFIATKSFRWEHPVMRTMWTSRSNHLSYKTWTVVFSSEWPLSFESRCRAEPCPVKVALLCFAIWLLLFLQCWGLCTPCCIAQYITISLSFFFFLGSFVEYLCWAFHPPQIQQHRPETENDYLLYLSRWTFYFHWVDVNSTGFDPNIIQLSVSVARCYHFERAKSFL